MSESVREKRNEVNGKDWKKLYSATTVELHSPMGDSGARMRVGGDETAQKRGGPTETEAGRLQAMIRIGLRHYGCRRRSQHCEHECP